MTTTIDHTDCLHRKDAKGRAECRKAGGPRGYLRKVSSAAYASGIALCEDCFTGALEAAMENIRDRGADPDSMDFIDLAWIEARGYLFDQGAISACRDHEGLL